jgi:hypothetical protein
MKPRKNFIIRQKTCYDSFGQIASNYYYIKEYKKFLCFSYWKYIKHKPGAIYIPIKFNNLQEARNFVEEVLCPEKPRNKWITKPVTEMVCTNKKVIRG